MNRQATEVREVPPGYALKADKPRVPEGYKQTEVGVIPEDWTVVSLGDRLSMRPSYGINAAAVPHSDRLPTYLRITDISEEGQFSPDPAVSVRSDSSENYYLEEGDIVFARTGASVGKSYLYRYSDGPLVYAGFLIRVRPDKRQILPAFLASYVTTGRYWQWVKLMSMRSGQPGINGAEYCRLPVPLPPLKEQRAIATALSDVDALLEELDRLIAKKRDIKQATMQQLLTGQTRLPGFEGEWKVMRAGDIGRFRGGGGFPAKLQGQATGQYPFFKVSDMNNAGNDTFMKSSNNYISEPVRKLTGAVVFPRGTIVFAKVGAAVFLERKKILTKPSCIDNNMAGYVVNPESVDVRFMHYALLCKSLGNLVSTTALPSLSGSVLSAMEFHLPPLEEQVAIAAFLSEMDAELQLLKQRRGKAADLKQATMQELLTGRTRLL